ncbi:MAG TPA: TIGR02466 family protein [Burkholderiales bacterium]|nr:TIGR02466 family protein [Burkholderiales bacterium]
MSAAPRMAFSGLWPTLLVSRRLPGFEQPNAGLIEHIYAQEARETDLTARFQEQSFFASSHPAVRWLKQQVEQTVGSFLQHTGVVRPVPWKLVGWYNVNRYGDHHAPHTHPWAYLSGTYYVRVPAAPPGVDDPRSRPACISFYDPRTGADMITAGVEPDARPAHVVRPSAGTLLMWPSPVQHSVHPNLSEEHRISISFNVLMQPGAYQPVAMRDS